MANNTNLKYFTKENAQEMGRKGGKKSGIVRTERKTLKEQLQVLLSLSLSDEEKIKEFKKRGFEDSEINNQLLLVNALFERVVDGDTKAFEIVLRILGNQDGEKNSQFADSLNDLF